MPSSLAGDVDPVTSGLIQGDFVMPHKSDNYTPLMQSCKLTTVLLVVFDVSNVLSLISWLFVAFCSILTQNEMFSAKWTVPI